MKDSNRKPTDDLKWVEEADKLHRTRGGRTSGVIVILIGLAFIYVAVASDWHMIYRVLPLVGGITMVLMGFGALRGA